MFNVVVPLLVSCVATRHVGFLEVERFGNESSKPGFLKGTGHAEEDHTKVSRGRWEEKPWKLSTKECGVTVKMTSADDMEAFCPHTCPFYAQDREDSEHCTFKCVTAEGCAASNPNKPVPDFNLGACRGPISEFCKVYNLDVQGGGKDTCLECREKYSLGEDGQCHFDYMYVIFIVAGVLVVIVLFLVVWIVDLFLRPTTNVRGLKRALDNREDQKLRQPKDEAGRRCLWPIFKTNIQHDDVAGAGMMLHFQFQKCLMVWGLLVGALWTLLALVVDNDLFVLGTKKFGTPRDNCILVAWGYETQHRLMWVKIYFLVIVYVASFILCIFLGVRQLRLFQVFEHDNQSLKDFAALIRGLPKLSGSEKVEDNLKKAIEEASGQTVIGVSVCWDYSANQDEIKGALDHTLDKFAKAYEENNPQARRAMLEAPAEEPEMNPLRKQFFEWEKALLAGDEDEDASVKEDRFSTLLKEMNSSKYAIAVFETEGERDEAVKRVAEKGFEISGNALTLEKHEVQADTTNWHVYGNSTGLQKIYRGLQGIGCILLALFFWTTVFYAPYAWSIFNFDYDNGAEPGFVYGMSFSMVVVVGNAIMYETCNRVSRYIGFKNDDDREACYVVLYTIACTFNIAIDMVTTYYTALYIMQGLDFRSYDGKRLSEIENFHDQINTYAMQRSLAANIKAYAWPSTFLIPFCIEPFVTIVLPLQIGKLLVRSHPEILGRDAEGWLEAAPMDLGRYGDLLLNVVLIILVLYFPGGYTHTLAFCMAGAHFYIYCFDHIKVLTAIPICDYASMDIDWWAQAMLAPCCGLILSCLVYKADCEGYGYCLEGAALTKVGVAVFFGHVVVHILILKFVVPLFGRPLDDENPNVPYKTVAKAVASNYFTCNPVHCLRSHFIYDHQPPCTFFEPGKEHLLEVNEKIGCYFSSEEATALDDPPTTLLESMKEGIQALSPRGADRAPQ